VEDDPHLGLLLKDILSEAGFHVRLCTDSAQALETIRRSKIDLGVLDVMLPGDNGFMLAERIRATYPTIPFLFLTARSLKEDKLKGYALGAVDYISKPFDQEILLCKIRAILNRFDQLSSDVPSQHIFQLGSFEFNYQAHSLTHGDDSMRLTEKENEVLYLLVSNLNKVVRRDEAVERIYGKRDYFLGRSFDVFISKIRKYLSPDPSLKIENVYRVGFILTAEAS